MEVCCRGATTHHTCPLRRLVRWLSDRPTPLHSPLGRGVCIVLLSRDATSSTVRWRLLLVDSSAYPMQVQCHPQQSSAAWYIHTAYTSAERRETHPPLKRYNAFTWGQDLDWVEVEPLQFGDALHQGRDTEQQRYQCLTVARGSTTIAFEQDISS